jgi:DNA-binding MarR family transcriptional regulator
MAEKLKTSRNTPVSDAMEADARELHGSLSQLRKIYQFRDRQRICCYDISVTQYYAINALVARGAQALKKLATELRLDKSTTSRLVDSLEEKGYVRRSADPGDGRAIRIDVTSKGLEMFEKIEVDSVAEVKEMLQEIDPDVRHATVRLFARLEKAASKRWGIGREKCRCTDSGN